MPHYRCQLGTVEGNMFERILFADTHNQLKEQIRREDMVLFAL